MSDLSPGNRSQTALDYWDNRDKAPPLQIYFASAGCSEKNKNTGEIITKKGVIKRKLIETSCWLQTILMNFLNTQIKTR